jgi:branched-chain amino acid transport system substrate-binding protein
MAVTLDSIDRAGGQGIDRQAVIDAFFGTEDRDSVLGTYSIDELGNTTLDRLAGYRVENGTATFDTPLQAP